MNLFIRGRFDGLSKFGIGIEKLAGWLYFHTARARADARFARAPVHDLDDFQLITTDQEHNHGRMAYDFGANHGLNFPYYLSLGFSVVAVEANPTLCRQLEARYASDIASGRVKILNACIASTDSDGVDFYIHRDSDLLSTFVKPSSDAVGAFDKVTVRAYCPASIFRNYGPPFYVKIDLEGLDAEIVNSIFSDGTVSIPYISTEAHKSDVFIALLSAGYAKFKIVEGAYLTAPFYAISNGRFRFSGDSGAHSVSIFPALGYLPARSWIT